ncbi:hypothetical protein M409DRAFT_21436 [Zasmidium cellare ATCC 36951]|uniref:amidase n=1 Tax=Zasmidium cellare ATCC 36951 TaxID=1080233 RepID=A0A6A6CNK0_ZASCE|nr:uncharacterized protein M409DRAFT_21436 [Zasmidium cellare ATCC 36951]KAF2168695.1 hypothetical protein M409DRAFT_21436 [Zasmidium cellare ATCC 36951]
MESSQNGSWEAKVKAARERLAKKIQSQSRLDMATFPRAEEQPISAFELLQSSGILSGCDLEITQSTDVTALLEKIHKKHYSAEAVVNAFIKRATLAHSVTNCLMDVDFEASLERARELDRLLATTGRFVGPLHGLPVSIKDLTAVKNLHYTMGYLSWADNVSEQDAVVVASLRQAGAIIFAKTTMPQSGMALETVSQLFGRTLNPHNKHMVAGGSSGGEGALIACRGSLLGIGTDSGGSIRIPAAFNGLYSIKPSSSRVSYKGNMNNSGSIGAASSIGPMAHSVRDLRLIMKVLIDDEHWLKDAAIVEKPWQDISIGPESEISIGVIEDDGLHAAEPFVLNALHIAKDKIEADGHQVTDIDPMLFDFGKGALVKERLSYELGRGFIRSELDQTGELPIEAIKHKIDHDAQSLEEVVENHRNWKQNKDDFLAAWMKTKLSTSNKKPIDALLLPVCSKVGFEHDTLPPPEYASIFNFLDYPAVTLPVTFVPETGTGSTGDAACYAGMPISVQLVSTTLTEEKLLAIAEIVDRAIRG